jgi:hypothetical protein
LPVGVVEAAHFLVKIGTGQPAIRKVQTCCGAARTTVMVPVPPWVHEVHLGRNDGYG